MGLERFQRVAYLHASRLRERRANDPCEKVREGAANTLQLVESRFRKDLLEKIGSAKYQKFGSTKSARGRSVPQRRSVIFPSSKQSGLPRERAATASPSNGFSSAAEKRIPPASVFHLRPSTA